MLAATLLTLLFVPVFYAVIEGLRERGHSTEKLNASEPEPSHVPAE
jgi:HAE1 family hydrophobic/amphiphilic exporter-1